MSQFGPLPTFAKNGTESRIISGIHTIRLQRDSAVNCGELNPSSMKHIVRFAVSKTPQGWSITGRDQQQPDVGLNRHPIRPAMSRCGVPPRLHPAGDNFQLLCANICSVTPAHMSDLVAVHGTPMWGSAHLLTTTIMCC